MLSLISPNVVHWNRSTVANAKLQTSVHKMLKVTVKVKVACLYLQKVILPEDRIWILVPMMHQNRLETANQATKSACETFVMFWDSSLYNHSVHPRSRWGRLLSTHQRAKSLAGARSSTESSNQLQGGKKAAVMAQEAGRPCTLDQGPTNTPTALSSCHRLVLLHRVSDTIIVTVYNKVGIQLLLKLLL